MDFQRDLCAYAGKQVVESMGNRLAYGERSGNDTQPCMNI